jgi:excisionase family DNA binding protein
LTTNEEAKKARPGNIITAGELADLLQSQPTMQAHSSTIYRLLRRGELRAFRVGSSWGFSRAVIDRLVQLEIRQ